MHNYSGSRCILKMHFSPLFFTSFFPLTVAKFIVIRRLTHIWLSNQVKLFSMEVTNG
jgi:hypothetical protein